jgi:hypothetical protein
MKETLSNAITDSVLMFRDDPEAEPEFKVAFQNIGS